MEESQHRILSRSADASWSGETGQMPGCRHWKGNLAFDISMHLSATSHHGHEIVVNALCNSKTVLDIGVDCSSIDLKLIESDPIPYNVPMHRTIVRPDAFYADEIRVDDRILFPFLPLCVQACIGFFELIVSAKPENQGL